ncbi:MAG: malate synthase A, partial [Planctomycetota bacterium]
SRTDRVLPDRGTVGMDRPFLAAYAKLLIQTCHQRGAFAMGGMAAQIPNRHDPEANAAALAKVRADKKREAEAGHDGTWVAHPGLIAIAREEMDAILSGPNQLDRPIEGEAPSAEDLVEAPVGTLTIEGLRANLDVALRYVESWLRGQGCVAIHGLMEDAATAEISRAQVWQWRRHGAVLEDGRRVTDALVREEMARALDAVDASPKSDSRFDEAAALLEDLLLGQTFTTFLTLPAYDRV